MSNNTSFNQIIAYMDQLHRDIGQLVALIEQLMQESGYLPLNSQGNRISWGLSNHLARHKVWRIPHLARFYVEDDEEDEYETSIFYFISLEQDREFEFPTVLCGRFQHLALTENSIYNQVFKIEALLSLFKKSSQWKNSEIKKGWTLTEPIGKIPVTQLQCYLLNLFDLSDRQIVTDNIITPLTQDATQPLSLTIPSYSPAGILNKPQTI